MEPQPIDTGWSWMICFSAAVNNFFVSGPLRSYGLMFVEIIARFQSSSAVTAVALALVSLAFAIMSPIAAHLGERYSQRRLVAAGAVSTCLGTFLTAFAPNVVFVCVTFGFLTGTGLACIFAPSMVMLGYYFRRRRALANGLAAAGGSLGQLVIPLLFTYLLQEYSFQGGLMIFSVLLLHVIPSALLLRPTSSYKPPLQDQPDQQPDREPNSQTDRPSNGQPATQPPSNNTNAPKVKLNGNHHSTVNGSAPDGNNMENRRVAALRWHSVGDIPCGGDDVDLPTSPQQRPRAAGSLQALGSDGEYDPVELSRTNSLYLAPYQTMVPVAGETQIQAEGSPRRQQNGARTGEKEHGGAPRAGLGARLCLLCSSLYEWRLLRNRRFLMYALGMCTGHMGYMSTCLFLPPFATEKGVLPYQVALLMSVTGGADLVGRVVGGAVGDLRAVRRNVLSGACLVVTGALTLVLPLAPYYPVMVVFCVVLGAIGGTYVALMLSVVIDLVGLSNVAPAFSLAVMGSGITAIPTPIVLGLLKDHTGTYDWSLVVCAGLLIVGGGFFCAAGLPRGEGEEEEGV